MKLEKYSVEIRLTLIRKTVCFFFITGIIMSFNLWISKRFFPLVPVFDNFPTINSPFDLILILALIALLGLCIFMDNKSVYTLIFILIFILAIQDQNRWQPWAFIYTVALIPFLVYRKTQQETVGLLNYLQFLVIGVYVWSGIHKINPNFIDFTYRNILTIFFKIEDPSLIKNLNIGGYTIPLTEIFIGIALFIPSLRNIGVYLATFTHIFILLYLSPFGINYNWVVYPWNIAMILLVYLLFFDIKNKPVFWYHQPVKWKILNLVTILLIWCLPLLNFFSYWDNYLSFSLYSDKIKDFYIAIEEKEIEKVDKKLSAYFVKIEGLQGGQIIDVNKWSLGELNVPFYPESRVFKKVSRTFCSLGIKEEKIVFLEFERPVTKGKYTSFSCKDVKE